MHRFEDDPAWVKYKCLEIAKDINRYENAETIIKTAQKLEAYIMPQATVLTIEGGKDAIEKRKQ